MDLVSEEDKWKIQKGTTTMFLAEVVGTAALLFVGCMGGVGALSRLPPSSLQSALTFGMTVNLIIMMLGHVSGAHLNPAVTIGAVIWGLKSIPTGVIYVIGQFIGATIGYGVLKMVTPPDCFNDGNPNSTVPLCVTAIHPEVTAVQAILIEAISTGIILCTACATWDPRCAHTTDSTALRFGFSVVAIGSAAGPYTGCSLNPARTFGPAVWNNMWDNHWVYYVGPVMGALLGTYTYQILFALPTPAYSGKQSANSVELKRLDSVERANFKALSDALNSDEP